MLHRRLARLFFVFSFFWISCGGDDPKPKAGDEAKVAILAFELSADSIPPGEKVTVTWRTQNADSVTLTANGEALPLGGATAASGSTEVETFETTEFQLRATGGGRTVESEVLTVRVEALRILSFEATPDVVEEGQEVVLSWRTENASAITITDATGANVDLGGQPASEGSVVVHPTASTIYTLRAQAGSQTVEAEASVQIRGAPGLTISLEPDPILFGKSTTLSWTMTEGEALRIEYEGELLHESNQAEGSFTHEPPLSGRYLVTATRAGRSAQASAEITVLPVILSFTATSEPTAVGAPVELSWQVGGARQLVITNGVDREELAIQSPDEGSLQMAQSETGRFELTASNGSVEVTNAVEVEVLEPPVIGNFRVHREVLSADPGEAVTVHLSWSGVEGASELVLHGDPSGPIELGPSQAGFADAVITDDTEFRLFATNAAGEAEATASVRLVPYPVIESFVATPSHVGSGESFLLRWETSHATSISIEANGVPVPGVDPSAGSGSLDLQIAADTNYLLRATNEAGDFEETTIDVTVGSPLILGFQASPAYAPAGGTVELEWDVLGGTTLVLEDDEGAVICSTNVLTEIAEGSCPVHISGEGEFEYTLKVENSVGDVSLRSLTVVTSIGPRLLAFSASPTALTVGESITFEWEVQDDPFGETPLLGLTDGTEEFDLSDADPNQGSKSIPITRVGDHLFTFRASTAAGTKEATVQATVHGVPEASLVAAPSAYDATVPVTLTWTSANADTSLKLYLLDESGTPIEPPLYEVPEEERAAGSFEIHPERASVYRIVAENAAGAKGSADASVTIAPPTILNFDAMPEEVLAGDEVLLSWTTKMATSVDLSIIEEMEVEEISEPFVDLRTIGGTEVTMTGACGASYFSPRNEGCATIAFPAGFTFPFGGVERSSIVMYANGFLGFSTYPWDAFTNQRLNGSNRHVAIAPFWDDLESGTFHQYFGTDHLGSHLILQWEANLYDTSSWVTFQVVLRENGDFEFRYAPMQSPTPRMDGSSATIGWQEPDGSYSYVFSHNSQIPGGLSGRSWRYFRPSLEPSGSYAFDTPAVDRVEDLEITLSAKGPGGEASETITVTVHPLATLALTTPRHEIEAGDRFEIAWETTHASTVEILDEGGVRCTSTPETVAEGACDLSEATPGLYRYTVRATGALGHVVEEEVELRIYIPLSLDFQVSTSELEAGNSLTLSWVTTGAHQISLTANGVELLNGTEPLEMGSRLHSPQEMTTYVFNVKTADGRELSASHSVKVRTFHFELSASATEVKPGTPVTISWNLTSLTGGTPTIHYDWALTEVLDGSAAFEDVSGLGQTSLLGGGQDGTRANVQFPPGFTFPYYGEIYDAIRVSADGWASFDLSADSWASNQPMPISSGYRQVHLPIFWDDLHTQSGRVDAVFLPNPDRFIVQWTKVGRYDPWTSRDYDLNFQIVLFPDGRFEYRYGTMAPPETPATSLSDCNPLSCEEETNGSSATIGYQNPTGTRGFQLHYQTGGASGVPFAGGLSNRSFRFAPPTGTSIVVSPEDPTDYEFCVSLGGFLECKTVTIDAAWEIDAFTASPTVVNHGQNVVLSWETRGADALTLEANGQTLDLTGKNLASDSLSLPLTETTTFELTLESLGRTKTVELEVEVRKVEIHVSAPQGRLFPGESIDIAWNSTAHAPGTPVVYGPVSTVGASPFTDISTAGAVEIIGAGQDDLVVDHTFSGNFKFPYFGEEYSSVRVSTDGYLSFATSTSTVHSNTELPNSAIARSRIHIAAFWDDLHTRSSGRVHALHASDGSYVFQWTGVSKLTGSSNSDEYDLNFQIALFPDGSFELRYGTMDPQAVTSSSCYPTSDCVGDANGASATIGYQDPSGTAGNQLHFGGEDQSSGNRPFPGGLSNRSFRVAPGASGSLRFSADPQTDHRLCSVLEDELRCDVLEFEFWEAGSILITEVMLAPAGGAAQWFELRNLTHETVNLEGWEIWTDSGLHTVDQPLLIAPYDFATFSAGSASGFTADYEFSGLGFNPAGDSLSVGRNGGALAQLRWDSTWSIQMGRSLELDALQHRKSRHHLASDSAFCPRTAPYSGANAGTPGWDGGSCIPDQPYVGYNFTGAEVFDIENTGATLTTAYDVSRKVNLSFSFPFMGMSTNEIWVSSSGFVTVTSSSSYWLNAELPSTTNPRATAGLIAPLWDDWKVDRHGGIVRFEERTVGGQKVAIVDWDNLSQYYADQSDLNAFQLQLWEDGRIVFAYRRIEGTDARNFGSSATIGLQEPTSTNPAYMLYSYNEANSIQLGQTLEFVPTSSP